MSSLLAGLGMEGTCMVELGQNRCIGIDLEPHEVRKDL